MTIEMRKLQEALDVLRSIEAYDPAKSEPGALGVLRAKAFCARSAIQASLAFDLVEVES